MAWIQRGKVPGRAAAQTEIVSKYRATRNSKRYVLSNVVPHFDQGIKGVWQRGLKGDRLHHGKICRFFSIDSGSDTPGLYVLAKSWAGTVSKRRATPECFESVFGRGTDRERQPLRKKKKNLIIVWFSSHPRQAPPFAASQKAGATASADTLPETSTSLPTEAARQARPNC